MTALRPLLRDLMSRAASAGSLDAVYETALLCVQRGFGIDRASLLLFDASDTMRFVAWAGLSEEYRRAVDGHSPWSRSESDAAPILVGDIEQDPSLGPYRAIMAREGVRALAFIPLQFQATLLGKFMLYYREPHEFSTEEIARAGQIADYVVFALEHHRIAVALEEQLISERHLRQSAELEAAQRQESENRMHVAMAAGHMGAWDWDLSSGRISWSVITACGAIVAAFSQPPELPGRRRLEIDRVARDKCEDGPVLQHRAVLLARSKALADGAVFGTPLSRGPRLAGASQSSDRTSAAIRQVLLPRSVTTRTWFPTT